MFVAQSSSSYLISKQTYGKKYKYNTGKPENPGIIKAGCLL